MLCYASGNRDEDVFEEPYSFAASASRTATSPSATARISCRAISGETGNAILFEELLPRLKSIALDGEVKMTAYFVNGPKKLPIRFEVN